ncbi:MAG: fumarate hydratase [Eggerthellaceae bacterium]
METIITKSQVADAVYAAIPRLACELPADIAAGLVAARAVEDSPRGRAVLDQLVENARIAEDRVPIRQYTGTVGQPRDRARCAHARRRVRRRGRRGRPRLRRGAPARVVRDAVLDRANTGDNTPVLRRPPRGRAGARLHIMPKGGD